MSLDLRTAIRQLHRAPLTTLAAIVTLAVGIGAATAVFSFVTAILSAGSPAPDMDRLVGVWSHHRGEAETKGLVSAADFIEWTTRARAFSAAAAWRGASFNVSGAGAAVREGGQLVTPGYLSVFGWQPVMGRDFVAADAEPGAPRVLIVSNAYWRNRLGQRPDVIGTTLSLDREPATIVGVLPHLPGVTGFFVPMSIGEEAPDRAARTLFVFARLAGGASLESARAELSTIGEALEREWPDTHRGWTVNVTPLQEEFVGPQARLVFALLVAIVITVLVIACANVANLLLARGVARRGEMSVRQALGAGTWRLTRQLLVECGLLAALGGGLSLVVSQWTLRILTSLGTVDSPWLAGGGLNGRVMLLTGAVSLAATVIAGLAPAMAVRRGDLVTGLRDTARSQIGTTRTTTRALVAGQVALAVSLLIVAGLATRTLIALQRLDPGFEIDNVLTASVTLPDAVGADASVQWMERALAEARRLPGVMSAGATSRLPFAGSRWNPNRGVQVEGQTAIADAESRWAVDYAVTPGFLESLRVPLHEGRTFTDGDGAGAPLVAIVSETMARRFWGTRSPLGARLRQGDEPIGVWRTVVGVVGDIRNDDADQPPLPYLYMPLAQQPSRTMTLALRTTSDPAATAEPLRRAMAGLDADQALYDVRTMRAVWEQDLEGTRVLIQVMAGFALVALGLAGLGVWGVSAQAVGQRTQEIGVRIAMGANAGQVAAMIARQGLVPLGVGLIVGLTVGLGLARMMRSILFQVSPVDPLTVAATVAVLFAVGAAATIGPALRAARLDPVTALKDR
jgi:putative ABC transport system permease protein